MRGPGLIHDLFVVYVADQTCKIDRAYLPTYKMAGKFLIGPFVIHAPVVSYMQCSNWITTALGSILCIWTRKGHFYQSFIQSNYAIGLACLGWFDFDPVESCIVKQHYCQSLAWPLYRFFNITVGAWYKYTPFSMTGQ